MKHDPSILASTDIDPFEKYRRRYMPEQSEYLQHQMDKAVDKYTNTCTKEQQP